MRSRYSAYAVHDAAHLRRTWDPATRPRRLRPDRSTRWTGLEVLATSGGGPGDEAGTVSFRAHHGDGVVAEGSVFRRVDGRWLYVGPA